LAPILLAMYLDEGVRMTELHEQETELLDASADPTPELAEHPDEVTAEEADAGEVMYHEVDDLDDDSSGGVDSSGGLESTVRETAMRRAQILRGVLLKHGVPEVSIELQAGRPSGGDDWNACKPVAVFSHHIASHPSKTNPTPGLFLVKQGRSDLPGPLCNGTAGVDLVYRITCMGLANHPGFGGPLTVRGPMGSFTIPKDLARPFAWGTEYEGGFDDDVWDRVYENRRTGVKMSFRDFMARSNAALVEGIWLINGRGRRPSARMDLSGYHGEHKTWAPGRKPDRRNYTTERGRDEIRNTGDFEPLPRVYLPNMQKAARGQISHRLPGVKRVQDALNARYGLNIAVEGVWKKSTTKGYLHHQKTAGNSPENIDGIPGPKDLAALGAGRFVVTK
jgi:hypothetical protein